jgi:TonB family protein
LAEPTLVTASGKEATSFVGQEVPTISATTVGAGGTTASIAFHEVGVKLTMTPTMLDEHEKISTAFTAEVSTIDSSNALQVPVGSFTATIKGFKTRRAQSEVVTRSGETIVIAGLLQTKDEESVNQVPGLGGMPVVGRLFRSPANEGEETELVIAVTPELAGRETETAERAFLMERALASAEMSASVDDPRLRYALQIQERIAKSLRYPLREKELGLEGRVKLKLHLSADGSLDRAWIVESSGIDAFDQEALKVAEAQSPYPQFPSQLSQRELWLEVPVLFRF